MVFAVQQVKVVTKAINFKIIGGIMYEKRRILWLTILLLVLSMRSVAFAEDAEVSTDQACRATDIYACLFEEELISIDVSGNDESIKERQLDCTVKSSPHETDKSRELLGVRRAKWHAAVAKDEVHSGRKWDGGAFYEAVKGYGLRYAKYTPLILKFRSVALEQGPRPETDLKTIFRSRIKSADEFSSSSCYVENRFENAVTKGKAEQYDEYLVGVSFSFRRFSLNSFYKSMLSTLKKPDATLTKGLASVSFFVQLPKF